MAVKPCQLVLIKRYPLDPKLRKEYEDEYCAGFETNWVHFQSNAVLFNRSDVKRDVLPELPNMPRHQIVINGLIVETAFEMVELIAKQDLKSFGWSIRRTKNDKTDPKSRPFYMYLDHFEMRADGKTFDVHYSSETETARVFGGPQKDWVLDKLRTTFPDDVFEGQELFTQ